ncbi:MAG: DUF4157 domain-containing protein [Ferruginibacter sp.]
MNNYTKTYQSRQTFLQQGYNGIFFQPKLIINKAKDTYEQQADAMADKVMRMEQPHSQQGNLSATILQRKCAACEQEELQRKETNNNQTSATNNVESYVGNLSGEGQSLPGDVRNFYEPRFRYDFSNVKIHTNTDAAKSAQSVNALAYTSGNHIVFNDGGFSPDTDNGKKLLGHELTHVIQQRGGDGKSVMRQEDKKKKPGSDIIKEIKKNPLFKKLPKAAQDKIIEELKSAPEKIVQKVADSVIDSLDIDDNLKTGLKKTVEAIIAKIKGDPKKFSRCDVPGFHPGGSSKFKGMCCTESIENDNVCCPPEKMLIKESRCCKSDEVIFNDKCVKPKDIPPLPIPSCDDGRQPTFSGKCCAPDEINIGSGCVKKTTPLPPPPPAPQLVIENVSVIGLKKDAPQTWYSPASSFGVSATTEGKATFNQLVTFLKQNPAASFRVEGHASSEKPKKDPDYNQRLTDRRVKLIASELQKNGIDSNRLKNIPDDAGSAGCNELSVGVFSCGDAQAQSTVEATDRNVSVKVFEIK